MVVAVLDGSNANNEYAAIGKSVPRLVFFKKIRIFLQKFAKSSGFELESWKEKNAESAILAKISSLCIL